MKKLLIILLSIQMLFALEVKEIEKGDIIEDSVERLEKKYYKVNIDNHKDIRVTLTDLKSDIFLYARTRQYSDRKKLIEKVVPAIRNNDCYSTKGNNTGEECHYTILGYNSTPGAPKHINSNVYIMVYGFEAGKYKLEVKQETSEKIDELKEDAIEGSVKKGANKNYKIRGNAGQTIIVTLADLTADADLRVKIGRKASKNSFDCKSTNGGSKTDSCSLTLEKDATVYVNVDGYKAASYKINKSIKVNNQVDLITHAKKQCVANENSNKYDILCSSEENIVFMIDSQTSPDHIDRQLYKVDIRENNEQTTIIKTVKHRKGQYISSFSFNEKWDNTPLFVLESINSMKMGNYCLYGPNGKSQFCNAYSRYGEWDNIRKEKPIYKVTEDAKKLTVTQTTSNRDIANSEKTIRKIYDITNPNEVKLISTEEI